MSPFTGIILTTTSLIMGFLFPLYLGIRTPAYNSLSQHISELYSVKSPNRAIRAFFISFFPGLLIFLYGVLFSPGALSFDRSVVLVLYKSSVSIYGISYMLSAVFPCDHPEPTFSDFRQSMHTLGGLLNLVTAISAPLFAGYYFRGPDTRLVSSLSVYCGILISLTIVTLLAAIYIPKTQHSGCQYQGVLQRVYEGCFLVWLVFVAVLIR